MTQLDLVIGAIGLLFSVASAVLDSCTLLQPIVRFLLVHLLNTFINHIMSSSHLLLFFHISSASKQPVYSAVIILERIVNLDMFAMLNVHCLIPCVEIHQLWLRWNTSGAWDETWIITRDGSISQTRFMNSLRLLIEYFTHEPIIYRPCNKQIVFHSSSYSVI